MLKYHTKQDFIDIENAKSFNDLMIVAMNVLKRIPSPISQVCGPISTGGLGNPTENLVRLDKAINYLDSEGHNVFYQIPFENKIVELDKIWKKNNPQEEYCFPVLEDIYRPIFESGLVKKLWFLPDWQSSKGATWERNLGIRLGLEIIEFPTIGL